MFEVEPFKTTQAEILEFAKRPSLPENLKASIVLGRGKWLHPGYYCPNGCQVHYVNSPITLPSMTIVESLAIATDYGHKHFPEFLETHGWNSRIVACVFCKKFGGAVLEGQSSKSVYRRPELKPFYNHRIITALCIETRIQEMEDEWWYSQGEKQTDCPYFEHSEKFKWVYKEITSWSEYPAS
jgi:hypothetical protein